MICILGLAHLTSWFMIFFRLWHISTYFFFFWQVPGVRKKKKIGGNWNYVTIKHITFFRCLLTMFVNKANCTFPNLTLITATVSSLLFIFLAKYLKSVDVVTIYIVSVSSNNSFGLWWFCPPLWEKCTRFYFMQNTFTDLTIVPVYVLQAILHLNMNINASRMIVPGWTANSLIYINLLPRRLVSHA